MRTAIAAHELLPEGVYLENLSIGAGRVSISAASRTRRSRCPLCGRGSSRVHSGYTRTLSDLPWHGISVELEVRARRFLCEEASCERKIFCERLPDVAARARKTGRLEEALLAIVLELGGRAGARLAAELGILVGRDALLARAKGAPVPELGGKVRVLGVDDFAFRRGARYGTILVDLERRRVVDLLPERSQESLVGWLERHPEVETATRDRSNIYREALAKGAPEATQVADRWHLLHNLALVLEEFLLQKGPALREAAAPEAALEEDGGDDDDDDAFGSGPIMPNHAQPPEEPRPQDRGGSEKAPRAAGPAVEGHPPPVPGQCRPQAHLPGARDKRQDRLPLQGFGRAASTPGAQEQERPRPVRAVPARAMERGVQKRQEAFPGDPRAGLRKQRGDLRPLHRPTQAR